ncbi:MAG: alcohol dehydrogenase catalytic domain-containing protein [Aquificales bacterium]|nr:alcohol dehydrogenase catalytic domain-containing protein [Aquificales bacterium]
MKAALCYEFGKPLVIEKVTISGPKQGEIKVKLAACAICHSDIHFMEGAWGGPLPALYGHEAAGIVVEVGSGVNQIKQGDNVIVTLLRSCGRCYFCTQGDPHLCETAFPRDKESPIHTKEGQPVFQAMHTGAFAEYVVVDQSQAVTLPPEMPLDSASLLSCGVITGMGAVVNTAQVTLGSSVVVIGTGGVGLNSVQGARLSGAQPIIAIDLIDSKLDAAKLFGATHGINSAEENAREAIYHLTGGRGADFVFVTVGSAAAMEQGLAYLRRGGSLVLVGMPPSGVKMAVEVINFAYHNQQILGSRMGSTRLSVDIPKWVALYQQGRLKLDELITARYPLEEINEAIAAVKRGDALRNVIIF